LKNARIKKIVNLPYFHPMANLQFCSGKECQCTSPESNYIFLLRASFAKISAFSHLMLRGSQYITDLINPVLPSLVDSKVGIMNLMVDLLAHALLFLTFCGCRLTTG